MHSSTVSTRNTMGNTSLNGPTHSGGTRAQQDATNRADQPATVPRDPRADQIDRVQAALLTSNGQGLVLVSDTVRQQGAQLTWAAEQVGRDRGGDQAKAQAQYQGAEDDDAPTPTLRPQGQRGELAAPQKTTADIGAAAGGEIPTGPQLAPKMTPRMVVLGKNVRASVKPTAIGRDTHWPLRLLTVRAAMETRERTRARD